MRVAVLGTGIMGAPMARNVAAAGHEVSAWNRSAAKARALEGDGVRTGASPAAAVDGAEIVVTMLADAHATAEVMDAGGALAAMGDGAVWAQAGTVGIEGIERLSAMARERGVAFVDAPVLGTKQPAEQGELLVLAAGPDEALERCAPVFDAIGSRTRRLGAAGEATRLKVVLAHWTISLVDLVAETVALAEAIGVDPQDYLGAIEGGAVDVGYAQLKGRAMIARDFPTSFPLTLARKDIELVLEAAGRHGVDLGLAPAVRERFTRAIDAGHGDEDMAAVVYATAPERR